MYYPIAPGAAAHVYTAEANQQMEEKKMQISQKRQPASDTFCGCQRFPANQMPRDVCYASCMALIGHQNRLELDNKPVCACARLCVCVCL